MRMFSHVLLLQQSVCFYLPICFIPMSWEGTEKTRKQLREHKQIQEGITDGYQ